MESGARLIGYEAYGNGGGLCGTISDPA